MGKRTTIIILDEDDGDIDPTVWKWAKPSYAGLQNEFADPCVGCSNNPKNNSYASGVCHCALPAMRNVTCLC